MAVSDYSESGPRFHAGLRALITLDRGPGREDRGAAETHEKRRRFVKCSKPQNPLLGYRLKKMLSPL